MSIHIYIYTYTCIYIYIYIYIRICVCVCVCLRVRVRVCVCVRVCVSHTLATRATFVEFHLLRLGYCSIDDPLDTHAYSDFLHAKSRNGEIVECRLLGLGKCPIGH